MSFFFLTDIQEKVFRSVTEAFSSVTEIAHHAKMPRTSVAKALERLESIGLVHSRKVREKNKHLYSRVTSEEVDEKIENLKSSIFEKEKTLKKSISFFGEQPISFFSGREGILSTIHDIISSRKNQKVYVVQGKDAAESWVSYLGNEEVLALHRKIVENELIVVSVRGDGLKGEIEHREHIKKSYTGRVMRVHAIPDSFFQEKTSVYAFRNTLLFVNLKKEYAIKINDYDIAQSFIKMINYVLDESKREV